MRLYIYISATAAFALLAWAGPSLRPAQQTGVNTLIPTKKEKLMTVGKTFPFGRLGTPKLFAPYGSPYGERKMASFLPTDPFSQSLQERPRATDGWQRIQKLVS